MCACPRSPFWSGAGLNRRRRAHAKVVVRERRIGGRSRSGDERREELLLAPHEARLRLAARPTPLSFHTFTPIEIDDPSIERRIIAEIEARRPDLVVVVPRDVREFGYRGFGVDYARGIASLLRRDYALAWRSGTRPEIAVLALRR